MDSSFYKDLDVQGLRYHYYRLTAQSSNHLTLLFLHGFPSNATHWANQIAYFSGKGYGVIALDMLGYGGTSKPTDVKLYDRSLLAAQCVCILDEEQVKKVVVVAHDWGCSVASRLANLYPDRLLAVIFIAVPYLPPNPNVSAEDAIRNAKERFGRDLFSYWKFFASEEGPGLLAEHEESFYSLLFTSEFQLWGTDFAPEGQLKKWLENDKRAPVGDWAPDMKKHIEFLKANGWYAPTNWYRSVLQGALIEGDKAVPKERYILTLPVLQFVTLRDGICIPTFAKLATKAFCTNGTVREIDTGHWPMFEKPDELNAGIDEFLAGL